MAPTRSAVCPACGASCALPATGRCGGCDVDLTHPALPQLLELERRRKVLDEEHTTLLARLVASRPGPLPPSSWERIDAAGGIAVPPPPPPLPERTPASLAPAPDAWASPPVRAPHRSVPTLLAIAGVALLTTAAVVFTAVTWTTLPSWLQAVIMLVATIVAVAEHEPLGYLILVVDGVHNFIGGLAVAGAFLVDIRVGVVTWMAAAAHEIPQELGDFGILIHAGWSRPRALPFNFLSALTFLLGGWIAYLLSDRFEVTGLLPFAAGSFVYIAAADLIPELTGYPEATNKALLTGTFAIGLGLLAVVAVSL